MNTLYEYLKMDTFYVYLDEMDIYYLVSLIGIGYLMVLLLMAAWFYYKIDVKRSPLKECAKCGPGASSFLVPSIYDGSKKVCPACADKEWENRPQSAPSLL